MTRDREEAYGIAEEAIGAITQAVSAIAALHAQDVTRVGQTASALADVLALIDRQGWMSSWAKDQEIIESARNLLADTMEREGTNAPSSSETQD